MESIPMVRALDKLLAGLLTNWGGHAAATPAEGCASAMGTKS